MCLNPGRDCIINTHRGWESEEAILLHLWVQCFRLALFPLAYIIKLSSMITTSLVVDDVSPILSCSHAGDIRCKFPIRWNIVFPKA